MSETSLAVRTGTRRSSGLPAQAVSRLYTQRLAVPEEHVPLADPRQHTMGPALEAYVAQRLPGHLLNAAVAEKMPVEVHGIYPYHLPRVIPGAVPVATQMHPRAGKRHNVVRPMWYMVPRADGIGGERLVAAVPPGRDYVLHYASMTRYYCATRLGTPTEPRAVLRYPAAENTLALWTALPELLRPGDRVLMGYAEQLVPLLCEAGATVRDVKENPYYEAIRLSFAEGVTVVAIGVRFSFWGSTAYRIARACQAHGVTELIYAGKLGTLTDPGEVYRRLYIPTCYVAISQVNGAPCLQVLNHAEAPRNGLLEYYPELSSGTHVSVPTVLEEDACLRRYADALHTATIDNEIAQFAAGLASSAKGVEGPAFSAIHFATDYLAAGDCTVSDGRDERRSRFNLANNRSAEALLLREKNLRAVAGHLAAYYSKGDRR